jgi:regulator of replication initiation timing
MMVSNPVNVLGLKLKMQKEKEQLMHEHLESMFEEIGKLVMENLALKEKASSIPLSQQEENEYEEDEEDIEDGEMKQEDNYPPVYMFVIDDTVFWDYDLAAAVSSQTDVSMDIYESRIIGERDYLVKAGKV